MNTKILLPAVTVAVICAVALAMQSFMRTDKTPSPDSEGHVLSTLWKEYYNAQKADLPKRMSESLDKIREEARGRRYHWDFYDATVKKVETETSRNWKLRDSLTSQAARKIEAYDEPIVTYTWKKRQGASGFVDFAFTNRVRLEAGKNQPFYSGRAASEMNGLLKSFIKNDFEYVLWSERLSGREASRAAASLRSYLGDSYPSAAWLEYLEVRDHSGLQTRKAAEEYVRKYEGRAVGLFAKALLLNARFSDLERQKAGAEEYKSLLADVQAAEKERKSFRRGDDGLIAGTIGGFKSLAERLEGKEIKISFVDGDVIIWLRNLDKVRLTMAQDRPGAIPLIDKSIDNPKRSFYVMDTVRVPIPRCDDGDYLVKAVSGKVSVVSHYVPKTLSIAVRADSGGWGFYVADSQTGRPADKVDLLLRLSGETVAQAKDVQVDGFTRLPGLIEKELKIDKYYTLEASLRDAEGFVRMSPEQFISADRNTDRPIGGRSSSGIYCNLFTDKSAYNPGETLKFKAVVYCGDFSKSLSTMAAGEKVKARLFNAESKEIASADLVTNEYGSVAGEFVLPEGERGGFWKLSMEQDRTIGSAAIVVDEFVLPTYDLAFDRVDSLYFMGDEIEVKGILKSYSGHPLDAATVSYTVDGGSARIDEGFVTVASDGAFSFRFQSVPDRYWYLVTVKVKDATGETKEFSRYVCVLNYLNVEIDLPEASSGSVSLSSEGYSAPCEVVAQKRTKVLFAVRNNDDMEVPLRVDYSLSDQEGEEVCSGSVKSGQSIDLEIPGSGLYLLTAKSSVKATDGHEISTTEKLHILLVGDDDKALHAEVENVFKLVGLPQGGDGTIKKGERIGLQIGAGEGPVWAVVELFGDKRQLLLRRRVHLEGTPGQEGSLTTVFFDYKDEYPDAMLLSVFYFRKGENYTFSKELRREKNELELPLSFSTFEDKALPEQQCSLTIKSTPDVEALAAVFDKSSETISPNRWEVVRLSYRGARWVFYQAQCGGVTDYPDDVPVMGYASPAEPRMYKSESVMGALAGSVAVVSPSVDIMNDDISVSDEYLSMEVAEELDLGVDDVALRSDFSTTLAFEPFLRPDKDGQVALSFKTSGKLSTFIVQVYAHTKDMRNAVLRREMTVTMPVKVSLVEPKYLYKGDKLVLHAVVSNVSERTVSGSVALQAYSSKDYQGLKPFAAFSKKVSVPAGESRTVEFNVDPKSHSELGLKVVFADNSKTFSDGVFVSLPVHDAEQTLTEAHSAVLLAGMDKNEVLRRLRSAFTGTTSQGAEYKEIDIRRMILDAVPAKVEPDANDVLSLSEALYVRRLAARLGDSLRAVAIPDAEIYSKIMACRNSDGGFGWFEGMKSSPVITAVILERFAKMLQAGLMEEDFDPDASVAYLDRSHFVSGSSRPLWSGSVSVAQYAYVRSLYPQVPFDLEVSRQSDKEEISKNLKEFQKFIKGYLTPSEEDGRGLNGQILSKARRIKTLANLAFSDDGPDLASKWGIRFSAESKMRSSLAADVQSLKEYAVEHRDGGWYYPNAVLPWRGLLESELYAHSLLCDLLSDRRVALGDKNSEAERISSGIRIWMMLQKETQKWDSDPAYIDALASVMAGGEDVLSTKVILMTKTYRKPFGEIASAGNGFTIRRRFFKEVLGENGSIGRMEIYPGERLKVGDKVTAEYSVWNQENRSFVKLVSPREAAFRPVDQLSGHIGWWLKPLSLRGTYSLTPQGYRNVKTDRTEYFFDVYPEENTTVREEFFITQEGTFKAPVVTIESMYAPHYRANDAFGGAVVVQR